MDRPQQTRRNLLLAALGAPLLMRAGSSLALDCRTAATSVMGPAYRPDAPARAALADAAEPGSALRMTGIVSAADTCRRIRDAQIEIWQADASGRYDLASADFHLRGRVTTNALGRYTFDTVVPGHYADQARHIHFRVTAKGYETHVTQVFFAGDEREHSDTLVKPDLVIQLGDAQDEARPGLLLGEFNMTLPPELPVDAATAAGYAACAGSYDLWLDQKLVITVADRHLRWTLTRPENAGEPVSGLLFARGGNLFFCPEYDYTIAFVKDEQGKVTHALIRDRQVARKIA